MATDLPHRPATSTSSDGSTTTRPRRMTLPSLPNRQDPIYIPAEKPPSDPGHQAAFIFVHGLGDTAEGLEGIAQQFRAAHKLPYMHWILPNAPHDHDAMTTAWYSPSSFSPFPPDRPELAPEEDEAGLLAAVAYLESLITACRNKGIPASRIVLGGFSQGCAISLLTELLGETYSGRLAGLIGLMGYLPLSAQGRRLEDLRASRDLAPTIGGVPIFLARGQADMLIPTRVWRQTVKRLADFEPTAIECHEYRGLGHAMSGPVLRDMCAFLERIVPPLED